MNGYRNFKKAIETFDHDETTKYIIKHAINAAGGVAQIKNCNIFIKGESPIYLTLDSDKIIVHTIKNKVSFSSLTLDDRNEILKSLKNI